MTALTDKLARRIRAAGPLTIEQFMQAALQDPEHGYYRRGRPFGAAGDFITAPEISQVFGELIGLWAGVCWQQMGAPAALQLIELGPGRGTLIADALRAARQVPGFTDAVTVQLVESHAGLRDEQQRRLPAGTEVHWHEVLDDVPAGPFIMIANEFIDALPVRQFIRRGGAWQERVVVCHDSVGLAFAEAPAPYAAALVPGALAGAADGSIVEVSPERDRLAAALARRVAADGGIALIIDYGYYPTKCAATLQAVSGHAAVDPLDKPGQSDLTAHVDFAALAARCAAASDGAARCHGPVAQGSFLERLGIRQRTAALIRAAANDADRHRIAAATDRLIDPAAMGSLFKAMAVSPNGFPAPAGFEEAGHQ